MWPMRRFRPLRRGTWLLLYPILVAGFVSPARAAGEPVFRFPWDASQKLKFTAGPHVWTAGIRSGLDFSSGSTKTPILAMADGTVLSVGSETCRTTEGTIVPCHAVKIAHDGGWETWYIHVSDYAPKLKAKDHVLQGQWIGNEGNDGAIKVHIHIELRKDGVAQSWDGRTIEGWTVHTGCAGYDSQKNTVQPNQECLTTNYNGYLSRGAIHMLPNSASPQYSVESSNKALPAALLQKMTLPATLEPGQKSAVTLRLQNIGPLDWPADGSIALMNINDQPLGTSSHQLRAAVQRGSSVDWTVQVTAPDKPGTYESTWQIARDGRMAGEPFTFHVVVGESKQPASWLERLRKLLGDFLNRLTRLINDTVANFQQQAAERVEAAKRAAIERAQAEARLAIERQLRALCGVAPGALVMAGGVVFFRQRRKRRP